uniref:cap-specific mRNA (nucleoside-2'-O-)-methyltransferase 1 n=1 Tax=Vespula vulgaris TaxID=7454 RepID=UPI00213C645F|nr:cap-specific mRNA (nucleoside-2'-O-)-methyltransferase 1 [Vespula vulgaris]
MDKINNFNNDLFLSENEYDRNDGDYNDNEVTRYHDAKSNFKSKTKKKYRTSASESTVKKKKRSKKGTDVVSNREKEASISNINDYEGDYSKNFNETNNDPEFEIKHISHGPFYEDFNKDTEVDRIQDMTSPFNIEASVSNVSKGIKRRHISTDDDTDNDDQNTCKKYGEDRNRGFIKDNIEYNIDKSLEKNRQSHLEPFYEDFNKDQFESSYEMTANFSEDTPTFNISKSGKIKYNKSFDDNKSLKINESSDQENSSKKICLEKIGNVTSNTTGNATNGKGKAELMMEKMGYQAGKGLGKNNQGRLEPVQTSMQRGRRGIGHSYPELEAASLKWDPKEEVIQIKEDMEWLRNIHHHTLTTKEMHDWMVLGPKKETIHNETKFCESKIVKDIINSKTIFDRIDKVEMRRARTRSNPYETIRGAFFLNRAAVKMANMDKACDFLFTKPTNLKNNELLYFADVCAGPGGFSEYVLWRKKWHAKGFGFTLKNENDFKLGDFYAGSPETFHTFYGPKGDGDVFDTSNQEAFRDLIMKHTHGKGVHFMMSDGGFSVEGQENIQEILSKQLYLCQCLVALMIVRDGGSFVTKLFDLFTPFSAGLVYLMYRCFDEICICKPNTSRPANSERYLICKGKRHDTHDVMKYLFHVNKLLLKRDEDKDVMELVPLEELEMEKEFLQYLRRSNNNLGKKQIIGLLKIAAFCEDNTLFEPRQADMRRQCLEYWELPDESRTVPAFCKPQDKIKHLIKERDTLLSYQPQKLTVDNIKQTILSSPYDWLCTPCGTGQFTEPDKMATFYMSMGRRKVYRYIKNSWDQINDLKIELPPDTLVYAEVISETTKERKSQHKVFALHILDAWILGGEDISQKYLPDRHELIKKFCEALWKPSPNDFARVRAKELYPFDPDIDKKIQIFRRLMKNNRPELTCDIPRTSLDDEDTPYFVPKSVIFLRSTSRPWFRYKSRSQNETYVHNSKTNESHYDIRRPPAAEAKFEETFSNSIIWFWPHDETLSMETVVQFVRAKCLGTNR